MLKKKCITIILIISWLTIGLTGDSLAAPAVAEISGMVSNGQTIIITGSDFGSGPNILLFDDFEKGSNGNNIAVGLNSAQIGAWTSVSGIPNVSIVPQYSNLNKLSGSLAMRADQTSNWSTKVCKQLPTNTTKIFISFWQLVPNGTNWPADKNGVNWKTIYIGVDGVASDNHTYLHQWLNGDASRAVSMTIFAYPEAFLRYANQSSMETGVWSRFSYYADAATTSSGILQVDELTRSGVIRRYNANNYRGLESGKSFNYLFVNYFARATSNCYPTYDDVYIAVGDNARARVEIGNNATYEKCTKLTICTPVSWSSTMISAKVWAGPFRSEPAYLFIIDSSGAVSPGRAIIFHDVNDGYDTAPPAEPKGVVIDTIY